VNVHIDQTRDNPFAFRVDLLELREPVPAELDIGAHFNYDSILDENVPDSVKTHGRIDHPAFAKHKIG
jgi:hypothetical protein